MKGILEAYPALVAQALVDASASWVPGTAHLVPLHLPQLFPVRLWVATEQRVSVELQSRGADGIYFLVRFNAGGRRQEELVTSVPQECHLGGQRWWALCPVPKMNQEGQFIACERRVNALWLKGGRLGCRVCQRLGYATQSVPVRQRRKRLRWSVQP